MAKVEAALLAALIACSAATADEPQLLTSPTAVQYGTVEFQAADLSSDGARVVAVRWLDDGASEIVIDDFSGGDGRVVRQHAADALRFTWCKWKTDVQLLCAAQKAGSLQHLLSVSVDGRAETELVYFEEIEHMLPDDPQHVLVRGQQLKNGMLDVRTGKFELFFESVLRYGIWDGNGVLRVRDWLSYEYFSDSRDEWVFLRKFTITEPDWFRPLAFDEVAKEVIYRDIVDDRLALFAKQIEGGASRTLLAQPFTHVVGVHTIGKLLRVGSAVVFDGQMRYEPIDPRVKGVRDSVQRLLSTATIFVEQEDWSQRYYLVSVRDHAGRDGYYRFDSADERLEQVGVDHAVSEGAAPLRTPLEFATADGQRAFAHVTIPAKVAAPMPLVVVPEDSSSDTDFVVPFLVASGYAVIELPLERIQQGQKNWGHNWRTTRAVIEAAVLELARAGTVDVERVCAVGRRYGAYAALMTARESADLFRCVVGIDTAIDPPGAATSVAERGSAISAALLLLSGKSDDGPRKLRRALGDDEAPVELVEYGDMDFQSTPRRVDLLARIGDFLDANLHP